MEREVLKLNNSNAGVLIYEDNGLKDRYELELDLKDEDDKKYTIIIDDSINAVSSSYIIGLFKTSSNTIEDYMMFLDKYHFGGQDDTNDKMNIYNIFIRTINIMYTEKFFDNILSITKDKDISRANIIKHRISLIVPILFILVPSITTMRLLQYKDTLFAWFQFPLILIGLLVLLIYSIEATKKNKK